MRFAEIAFMIITVTGNMKSVGVIGFSIFMGIGNLKSAQTVSMTFMEIGWEEDIDTLIPSLR